MACTKCKKRVSTEDGLCQDCFCDMIEKRVKKELRSHALIKKGDEILVIDDDSYDSKNSYHIIEKVLHSLPCVIKIKKLDFQIGKKVKADAPKIVIPWNLDDECAYFLHCLLQDTPPDYVGHYCLDDQQYIKLLLSVTDKESRRYAKIKNFRIEVHEEPSKVKAFLDTMEEAHPETKHSILKSISKVLGKSK